MPTGFQIDSNGKRVLKWRITGPVQMQSIIDIQRPAFTKFVATANSQRKLGIILFVQ